MEYAWTLKVTKNDGSDQYTHLVDQGLFIKFIKSALLHSQKPQPFYISFLFVTPGVDAFS